MRSLQPGCGVESLWNRRPCSDQKWDSWLELIFLLSPAGARQFDRRGPWSTEQLPQVPSRRDSELQGPASERYSRRAPDLQTNGRTTCSEHQHPEEDDLPGRGLIYRRKVRFLR